MSEQEENCNNDFNKGEDATIYFLADFEGEENIYGFSESIYSYLEGNDDSKDTKRFIKFNARLENRNDVRLLDSTSLKNANWSIHIQESTEFVRYSRKLCGEIYCIFDEKSQSNVTGINASLNSKYFESLLEIARSRKPLTFYITARSRSLKFDYYQNIMIWDGKAKDTLWLSEIGFSVSL